MTMVPVIDGATGQPVGVIDAPDPVDTTPAAVDLDALDAAGTMAATATTVLALRVAVCALVASINHPMED